MQPTEQQNDLKRSALEDLASKIAPGMRTVFDFTTAGRGQKIEMSLQKLEPEPPRKPLRAESRARSHAFLEHKTFAAYLARFGRDNAIVVWANPEDEKMWACLDEDASEGREILEMAPQLHPLWVPWDALVSKGPVAVGEFRSFLMANSRVVTMPKGRELALKMQQLRAAVDIQIHDGRGKNALNGITFKSRIEGQESKDYVELPEEIVLRVPLYVDAEVTEVHLDLVVDADARGSITCQIAAAGVNEARAMAFDGMVKAIREALKAKKATVTYGSPREVEWSYLRRQS